MGVPWETDKEKAYVRNLGWVTQLIVSSEDQEQVDILDKNPELIERTLELALVHGTSGTILPSSLSEFQKGHPDGPIRYLYQSTHLNRRFEVGYSLSGTTL